MKSITEIEEKIKDNTAVVLTAEEFKARVRAGTTPTPDEVDVVTCGTCGVMSGIYAVMTIPIAEVGEFAYCEELTLNSVPCFIGPCPNERLGMVDIILSSTARASSRYGGGDLLKEIVEGKDIEIHAKTDTKTYDTVIFSDEIESARMFSSRSAYKNYSAFVNSGTTPANTIFSVLPLPENESSASVAGCGEINPIENDPSLRFLRSGANILFNGAVGKIIGEGTRSTKEKPNLSVFADMKDMMPEYMGGFITSAGLDSVSTIAAAIPVVDQRSIDELSILDSQIPLHVYNYLDRKERAVSSYDSVWQNTDRTVEVNPMNCMFCGECPAGMACPTKAVMPGGGIIASRCISCGTCLTTCPGSVYSMNMGSLKCADREIPISLRESGREKANEICNLLKDLIENGEFKLY